MLNMEVLALFTPTATTTSSKSGILLSKMFMWPRVMGSNDPGKTAFFMVDIHF
jgi:hypothetical protein